MRIRNAFGKFYTVHALPREKIEEVIENLDWEKVISECWNHHCDSYGRTEVQLDITTGKIGYARYTGGSGDIETHFLTLYTLEQNILGNMSFEYCGDLLDDEESTKIEKMMELGDIRMYEEGMQKLNIDFDERFADFLFWLWNDGGREETLPEIQKQIEEIYASPEEEENG
jgi:hypothetical protein